MPDKRAAVAWEKALRSLREQVNSTTYTTWLAETVGISLTDTHITIAVPSDFAKHWMEGSLLPVMERSISEVLGKHTQIDLVVLSDAHKDDDTPTQDGVRAVHPAGKRAVTGAMRGAAGARPDPKLTFEQFVEGKNTRLAYTAAGKVARGEGSQTFNPLVLYGPPGLGKTHLLHAIANEANHHGRTAYVVTSEQFVNDYVTSVQNKTTQGFREHYRSPDILALDDVQFICGKTKSEEALLHTCGALLRAGGHIVVSADRPPQALNFKNPRLAARLQGGLPVDITLPDRATRSNILAFKASQYGQAIPDDVLAYLANRKYSSITQLEGNLTRVIAHATLLNEPLTLELARQALSSSVETPDSMSSSITPEDIIRATAAVRNLSPADLTGRSRERSIADARHLAIFLSSRFTQLSLAAIGRSFGGRDHTTVMNSIKRIETILPKDARLQDEAETIIQLALSTSSAS